MGKHIPNKCRTLLYTNEVIASMEAEVKHRGWIRQAETKVRRIARERAEDGLTCGQISPVGGRPGPSPQTLEEAARVHAAPRELRHILCGDPLPGRSALDRRRHS